MQLRLSEQARLSVRKAYNFSKEVAAMMGNELYAIGINAAVLRILKL